MACRALVQAMGETLWRAGGKRKAVVAVLDIPEIYGEYGSNCSYSVLTVELFDRYLELTELFNCLTGL
jgi:hypothetical protein